MLQVWILAKKGVYWCWAKDTFKQCWPNCCEIPCVLHRGMGIVNNLTILVYSQFYYWFFKFLIHIKQYKTSGNTFLLFIFFFLLLLFKIVMIMNKKSVGSLILVSSLVAVCAWFTKKNHSFRNQTKLAEQFCFNSLKGNYSLISTLVICSEIKLH